MSKSKITVVVPQPDRNWGEKILKKDLLVFENGETGIYTTFPDKTQPTVGEELDFEIVDKGFGAEVKPVTGGTGGGGRPAQKKTPEQEAMICSVAICKSALEGGKLEISGVKTTYLEMYAFFLHTIKTIPTPDINHIGSPDVNGNNEMV